MQTAATGKMMIAMVAMLAVLTGCSGKTKVESNLRIKGAPDWVNEGTNILNDKGGRLFHGVGSAPPMGDQSLQVSTADNRARAELARILTSYLQEVSRDYLSSSSGTGTEASNEQEISREITNITKVNLVGAKVIGRWKDKRTGVVYSLVELDMKRVKETVAKTEKMNEGLRQFIDTNAENIFDRMIQEGRYLCTPQPSSLPCSPLSHC